MNVGRSRIFVRPNHELRFSRRGATGVVDEPVSRRSSIHAGRDIPLANGQEWTFPAPTDESGFAIEAAGAEYLELICAVLEAEDSSDRRLAELALAILLIGLNYQLSSTDLANLLTFQPRSQALADSQHAFEALARDHILWLASSGKIPVPAPSRSTGRPLGSRVLAWLRGRWLMRTWLPDPRNGEAMPKFPGQIAPPRP